MTDTFPRAKHLGPSLVAFTLNISEKRAAELLDRTIAPDIQEQNLLMQLEKSLEQIARGRFHNLVLEFHDLVSLTSSYYNEGRNLFTALRHQSGADPSPNPGADRVEIALSKLCFECFPITLLPENSSPLDHGLWQIPLFFKTSLLDEFMSAVREDTSLMAFFPNGAENEFSRSVQIFTSFGRGSSFQLCSLHSCIISSAIPLMQLRGECSIESLQSAAIEMLGHLRKLAIGESVSLPVIDVFDLVGFTNAGHICALGGNIKTVPNTFENVIPSHARPAKNSDNVPFGFLLHRQAKFSIAIVNQIDPTDPIDDWPLDITIKGEGEDTLISLATALALPDNVPTAARKRATITIDPVNGASKAFANIKSSLANYHLATADECDQIAQILDLLNRNGIGNLQTAAKRYVNAVINRDDLHDSLIDAVIGLESLFGARSEIAFHVSAGVSTLIGKTNTERHQIFGETKKIYETRSKIVHGDRKITEKIDVSKLRSAALIYLKRSIFALISDRRDLLTMDSDLRVKTLILGAN